MTCCLAIDLELAQTAHRRRGSPLLFGAHPFAVLDPFCKIGPHPALVLLIVEDRSVDLFQVEGGQGLSDLFRRLGAMDVLIEHRLDANAMPLDADIIRCEKIEIVLTFTFCLLIMKTASTEIIPACRRLVALQATA